MRVAVKYLICLAGFVATGYSVGNCNTSSGFAAAGAFIAFALLEINDLKIINDNED